MRILFLVIILFSINNLYSQQADTEAYHPKYNELLVKHLRYPSEAVEKNLQGQCQVSFTVHIDGKTSDFKVIKGVSNCPECDQEAIRVLKLMKKWKPAIKNGKPVESQKISEINFILH
ncbi:MAG: energy transducer TonB [Bacteroidota bacterium]